MWNARVHDKLKTLGAEMNSTVFHELQALLHAEDELKQRSRHMGSDFLNHLSSDEVRVGLLPSTTRVGTRTTVDE